MPSIYLLDKGNKVILKDCSPEVLMQVIYKEPAYNSFYQKINIIGISQP